MGGFFKWDPRDPHVTMGFKCFKTKLVSIWIRQPPHGRHGCPMTRFLNPSGCGPGRLVQVSNETEANPDQSKVKHGIQLRHWRSGSMALAVGPGSCDSVHDLRRFSCGCVFGCGSLSQDSQAQKDFASACFSTTGSTGSWPLHAVALQSLSPECAAPRYCAPQGFPATSWRGF